MKGIILAGGSGTRLYPLTLGVVKQLLPIYDKPMIYYPLSVLMLAGIKEVLIISTQSDIGRFELLFGDGASLGMKISYKIQESPRGLAEAFILGEDFIQDDHVCLVLGDNLLYGDNLSRILKENIKNTYENKDAVIFGYQVSEPSSYGVVEFDSNNRIKSIVEKPKNPKSKFAVIGLYFYPNNVVEYAKKLQPSSRGELEITDINNIYLKNEKLRVELLGRGYAWLDTGHCDDLLDANQFVQTIERRQGKKIACLEEIAYFQKWISKSQLEVLGRKYEKSNYGKYILELCSDS